MSFSRNEREWRDNQARRNREEEQRNAYARDHSQGGGHSDGGHSERGFFERAGDEISSWFGDDDNGRRGGNDGRSAQREERDRHDEGRRGFPSPDMRDRSDRQDRDRRPYSGRPPEHDMDRRPDTDRDHGYRPMTGDYSRSAEFARHPSDREQGAPRFASGGSSSGHGATAAHDRHYAEWRQRQIDQIDRDYEEYRHEHQSKFESDFSNWRSTRQSKREMLGSVKEQMQVFGSDEQPVGTVDKVRGDRIILTKDGSPDGQHHSINLTMIDRVEGDRVMLGRSAEEAKAEFGSEERDRALNERDDQGGTGPHILDRSFSGTY